MATKQGVGDFDLDSESTSLGEELRAIVREELARHEAAIGRLFEGLYERLDGGVDDEIAAGENALAENARGETVSLAEVRRRYPRKVAAAPQYASDGLLQRVRAVFTGAIKKGQGQAVTFLVRHLGRSPDEIRTALGELVKAGEIYVRPHMRGQLYYLAGEGPGPVRVKGT